MSMKTTMSIICNNEDGKKKVFKVPNAHDETKRSVVEEGMRNILKNNTFKINEKPITTVSGIKRTEYGDWEAKEDMCNAKGTVKPTEKTPGGAPAPQTGKAS